MERDVIINRLTNEILHQTDVEGIKQCIAMAFGAGYERGRNTEGKNISVTQLTSEGHIITEFESVMSASRFTKINHSDIVKCCKGKRKRAGGYQWQYTYIN